MIKETFLVRCIGHTGGDIKPCGYEGTWSRIVPNLDESDDEPAPCPECDCPTACVDLLSQTPVV